MVLTLPGYPPAAAPLPPLIPRVVAENLAEITEPIAAQDTAFFWHIPKAGGSTLKAYYGRCLHKVESTEVGGMFGHDQDQELGIFTRGDYRYVNVDTSTPEGIEHAKEFQLAESGYADIVVSTYLHGAADLFNPVNRGRFFAIFRHPIERAASHFYYRQKASWEKAYGKKLHMLTIEQFLSRGRGEKNWMVRVLTNKFTEALTGEDLEMAKEILRTRCVVGMMDRMQESLDRFDMYFGWASPENQECKNELLNHGVNSNPHAMVEVGSEAWNMLYEMNELDIKLYEYAQILFEEQRALLGVHAMQQ